MLTVEQREDEIEEYLQWEKKQTEFAFFRSETRHTRLKRGPLDCGHVIDGGEPYRYQVSKLNCDEQITQRRDCEFCARKDDRY